ncbi:hypothetical protein PIB30_022978 [Stylosanthes scabra]|uniref:Uncharacterized protein n=1 Tax=Stylosanthes scabra TaxID=79078 RepID=A0ABU6T903_9FABA|nr:hypothetical protein [Stylosanthes scabra]
MKRIGYSSKCQRAMNEDGKLKTRGWELGLRILQSTIPLLAVARARPVLGFSLHSLPLCSSSSPPIPIQSSSSIRLCHFLLTPASFPPLLCVLSPPSLLLCELTQSRSLPLAAGQRELCNLCDLYPAQIEP